MNLQPITTEFQKQTIKAFIDLDRLQMGCPKNTFPESYILLDENGVALTGTYLWGSTGKKQRTEFLKVDKSFRLLPKVFIYGGGRKSNFATLISL